MTFKHHIPAILSGIIFFSIAVGGCKKESFPSDTIQQPNYDFSAVAGSWTAEINAVRLAECLMNPNQFTAKQEWKINNRGDITIDETSNLSTVPDRIWRGKINDKYELDVIAEVRPFCFGTESPIEVKLKATIMRNVSPMRIETVVDFPLCPPSCLYKLNYLIIKK